MGVVNITPQLLYPRRTNPGSLLTERCVGRTTVRGVLENRETSFPCRESNPGRQARSPAYPTFPIKTLLSVFTIIPPPYPQIFVEFSSILLILISSSTAIDLNSSLL